MGPSPQRGIVAGTCTLTAVRLFIFTVSIYICLPIYICLCLYVTRFGIDILPFRRFAFTFTVVPVTTSTHFLDSKF